MSIDSSRLMSFLSGEGFRPTLAAPGDIRFKFEGGNYAVRFTEDDDQYMSVIFPNFWAIESPDEELRAVRAANQASQLTKVAKVYVVGEQHNVWAEAELLIVRPEDFETLFARGLQILKAGVGKFVDLMRKAEPLPDKRVELRREEVARWTHGN